MLQLIKSLILFRCAQGSLSPENQRKHFNRKPLFFKQKSKTSSLSPFSRVAKDHITKNILCLTLASPISPFWEDFLHVHVRKYWSVGLRWQEQHREGIPKLSCVYPLSLKHTVETFEVISWAGWLPHFPRCQINIRLSHEVTIYTARLTVTMSKRTRERCWALDIQELTERRKKNEDVILIERYSPAVRHEMMLILTLSVLGLFSELILPAERECVSAEWPHYWWL